MHPIIVRSDFRCSGTAKIKVICYVLISDYSCLDQKTDSNIFEVETKENKKQNTTKRLESTVRIADVVKGNIYIGLVNYEYKVR